jgi:hypothetical protein
MGRQAAQLEPLAGKSWLENWSLNLVTIAHLLFRVSLAFWLFIVPAFVTQREILNFALR